MLLFYLGLLVLITTVFCELAAKKDWLPYWVSRKILHIIAVGSCAVAGYYADVLGHRTILTWIVAVAEVTLLGLIGFGGLMREESGRKPWGIVWFPLAFLILLVATENAETIGLCMGILAICDPAATIAGKLFGESPTGKKMGTSDLLDDELISTSTVNNPPQDSISATLKAPWPLNFTTPYQLTGDPKTLIGNIAFFGTAFVFTAWIVFFDISAQVDAYTFLEFLLDVDILTYLISFSLLLTVAEALGSRGADNLYVPLLAIICLEFNVYSAARIHYVWITLPLAFLFCWLTYRRKSLSAGGGGAAVLLGIIIVFTAGPVWLVPLFVFFLSSSFIGKLLPIKTRAGDEKHKLPRDATQVMANGAVYVTIIFLATYRGGHLYQIDFPGNWGLCALCAAAIATADTWSSEVGQYFGWKTYYVTNYQRVPPGLSGGVSVPGTVAGFLGAVVIASLSLWLLPNPGYMKFQSIVMAGITGMLIDSLLGALFQATYRDPQTGNLSDTRGENGQLASGYSWMTNDLVNFLAILLTVLLVVFIQLL